MRTRQTETAWGGESTFRLTTSDEHCHRDKRYRDWAILRVADPMYLVYGMQNAVWEILRTRHCGKSKVPGRVLPTPRPFGNVLDGSELGFRDDLLATVSPTKE